MIPSFHHAEDVLDKIFTAAAPMALAILTHVSGGSLRAQGAMMAISEQGESFGYISQGCVDADIVAHGVAALKEGKLRAVSYGEGSPFGDITLPCGGRLEVLVLPRPDFAHLRALKDALARRKSATIHWSKSGYFQDRPSKDTVSLTYTPKLRLILAGRGDALRSLAQMAPIAGLSLSVFSPDHDDFADIKAQPLLTPQHCPELGADRFSAGILLFHDHDWESAILSQLLRSDAFYIGAMGSSRTHANRIDALKTARFSAKQLARIHGPIGHLPGLRDAGWLSASILSDVASAAREKGYI